MNSDQNIDESKDGGSALNGGLGQHDKENNMTKKYPVVGLKKKPKHAGGLPCIICEVPTTGTVDIEVNCFRGDDDQVRVCTEHQIKNDAAILDAYIRANATVRRQPLENG